MLRNTLLCPTLIWGLKESNLVFSVYFNWISYLNWSGLIEWVWVHLLKLNQQITNFCSIFKYYLLWGLKLKYHQAFHYISRTWGKRSQWYRVAHSSVPLELLWKCIKFECPSRKFISEHGKGSWFWAQRYDRMVLSIWCFSLISILSANLGRTLCALTSQQILPNTLREDSLVSEAFWCWSAGFMICC